MVTWLSTNWVNVAWSRLIRFVVWWMLQNWYIHAARRGGLIILKILLTLIIRWSVRLRMETGQPCGGVRWERRLIFSVRTGWILSSGFLLSMYYTVRISVEMWHWIRSGFLWVRNLPVYWRWKVIQLRLILWALFRCRPVRIRIWNSLLRI